MHQSPKHGWMPALADPLLPRSRRTDLRSAKVLVAALTLFYMAAFAAFPLLAASPLTQEEQSQPAAKSESTDQPASSNPQSLDLSDEVVRDVLTNLQLGIGTHNLDRVLQVFDPQNMKEFAQFRDQMVAFFRRYDSVKFRYHLLQVTSDKEQGFAIADIDMDADPSDILPTQQRRSTQMRFQMKRGPKGWKVTGLRPADFFNQ